MSSDFIPEQRKSNYDGDYWKHSTMGDVGWQDSYDASNYAQQIKAAGPVNSEYNERYAALSKGDSAVDDDGQWKTLKSAKNSEEGTQAEFEALAKEWKAAGYDVRVQDLDNSQGAEWADIAVRKGDGKQADTGPQEPEKPIALSPKLANARARVQQYEEDVLTGRTVYGKESFEQNDGPSFLDRYKLKLGQEIADGRYEDPQDRKRYDSEYAQYEIDKAAYDARQS